MTDKEKVIVTFDEAYNLTDTLFAGDLKLVESAYELIIPRMDRLLDTLVEKLNPDSPLESVEAALGGELGKFAFADCESRLKKSRKIKPVFDQSRILDILKQKENGETNAPKLVEIVAMTMEFVLGELLEVAGSSLKKNEDDADDDDDGTGGFIENETDGVIELGATAITFALESDKELARVLAL
eukprot:c3114_g1_i1.p2 GENE.c3114_g1_i1~~c3114_g1_i1.p2  ORF type:complete len:185 (-),score=54.67 c3114_g1_i1:95-649(-)